MSTTRSRCSEPIRKPWIWGFLVLLLLAGVPWYLPTGMIRPIVFGVPLWTLLTVFWSVALSAYLSWVLSRHWRLVEDEETGAAAAGHENAPEERG